MGITVFYGTDKEMLGIRNKLLISHSDVNTIMLVPEQFSLSTELAFSDVSKINFEVLSFRRLCKKIFESAGKVTGGYISSASKVMVMQKVIDANTSDLVIYKGAAEKDGFASMMTKTVSEFKHADVAPDVLASKIEDSEGYLKDKLKDFWVLYSEFNKFIENIGWDSDDDLSFAYELLKENVSLYKIAGSRILINNFNGFTRQEKKLIKLFADIADVYISVLADSMDSDASVCFSSTINNIKNLTENIKTNYVYVEAGDKYSAPQFLADNYFKYPCSVNENNSEDISIKYGKNAFYEVCGVASEIVRLCRENSLRFRDISVVYRNSDVYCSLIRRVFDMFKIPHFLDYREPADNNPLITFIYAIADILEYNYSYDSVMTLVKSVFSPVSAEDADIFENFVLEYGCFGKNLIDDELWDKKIKYASERHQLSVVSYVRNNIVLPLKKFREKTLGSRAYADHARALFELLADYNVFDRLKKITEETSLRGDIRTSEVYSRIWNVFINMMDEVVSVVGDCKGSFLKFMSVFKAGMSESTVGVVPPVIDCVNVYDGQRFVGGEIKALFVVGVNNGEFPTNHALHGVFDGADRDLLSGLGVELTVNRITSAVSEQEILYKIFTGASEKLCFSYRNTNLDSSSVAPSEVIDRVRVVFPDINISEFNVSAAGPEYTFLQIIATKDIENPDYADAYAWFSGNSEWKSKLELLDRPRPSNSVKLSEESVEKLHGDGFKGSISQLETYAKCPFSYFVKYNLRAKPRKVFKIGAPDIGSLVHNVIEYSAIEIDKTFGWDSVSKDMCTEVVEKAVASVAPEFLNGLMLSSPRYRYTLTKVTKLMSKNLYYIARQFSHSKFRPAGYEISFGENCEEQPIKLVSKSGKTISLTGKIDRCDVLKKDGVEYLRIIDYKTGNKELKLADVYNGLNLQLLTYLDAVCSTKHKPAGVLYFRVDDAYTVHNDILDKDVLSEMRKKNYCMKGLVLADGDILMDMDDELLSINVKDDSVLSGDVATEEEFEVLRSGVKQSIRRLSEGILGGVIDIAPVNGVDGEACGYCDFKNICRSTDGCRKTVKFSGDEEVYAKMREEQKDE